MQFQPPALEDLEAPRRQTSLDGEAIKIIIHDVDSGPFLASKRRVTLRRDPTDKAHRSKLPFANCDFHINQLFCSFSPSISISIFHFLSIAHDSIVMFIYVFFQTNAHNSSRFWNACGWW